MPEVGQILEGKVTTIMKYGAFVALEGGGNGLVHISEIANGFVQEVRDQLTEGQTVRVKVIGVDENGKVRLSIKKALPQTAPAPRGPSRPMPRPKPEPLPTYDGAPDGVSTLAPSGNSQFEDRLKSFLQDSSSRMSDLKHQADRKGGGRGRRK